MDHFIQARSLSVAVHRLGKHFYDELCDEVRPQAVEDLALFPGPVPVCYIFRGTRTQPDPVPHQLVRAVDKRSLESRHLHPRAPVKTIGVIGREWNAWNRLLVEHHRRAADGVSKRQHTPPICFPEGQAPSAGDSVSV